MADAVVSYAVERLGDYLINKVVFLEGVRSEVKLLKKELEWMQCFIKDAEERQNDDPMIRKWVSDIKDLAEDAGTVLHTFILKVDDKSALGRRSGGLLGSFLKCSCITDKGKEKIDLYDIGKDIEALKRRIEDLNQKCTTYGLQKIDYKKPKDTNARKKLKEMRRTTSREDDEKVVGLEDAADELQARLLDNEPCRFITYIVGMGGLGKTTMARKLYNKNLIRRSFNFHGWVCVSQEYETHDLLIKIIKSFNFGKISAQELKTMETEDLERHLYKSLKGRSYLVVIDDVWEKEAWRSLKRAFPDDSNGSRVIITTRKMDVAAGMGNKTHVHRLRLLTEKESWELFCNKAFVKKRDDGLEKLGGEMMQKCCGLPLAIIVLSGLLSQKDPNEWREVRNNIFQALRKDSMIEINSLLDLSFDDLPYQLKSVFLYLSLFPEDFDIDVEKLIRLLVVEDLVTQDEDRVMEEAVRHTLNELCDRSLVQVEKTYLMRWTIVKYRLHDLLRDLAIKKAKEQCFSSNCDTDKDSSKSSIVSTCRRYAFYNGRETRLGLPEYCNDATRTLLFFKRVILHTPKLHEFLLPICQKFMSLKVLDLDGLNSLQSVFKSPNCLPIEIGKLIHLKYLGLRNAFIKTLPSSIGNVRRLQTLDLLGSCVELPTEISKLEELRHLIGRFNGPLSLNNLTNLQTLGSVEYHSWMELEHEELVNLQELKVYVRKCESNIKSYSLESIGKLRRIHSLELDFEGDCYVPCLQPLVNCSDLIKLRLYGKMEKLPKDLHTILPNLQCLSLIGSGLKNDPMPILENFPNLMGLTLRDDAYCGEKMVCSATGFSRLEVLELQLSSLMEWEVEDGAMPVLQELEIIGTPEFNIPSRLLPFTLLSATDRPVQVYPCA